MFLNIDPTSELAIYEQVVRQVKFAVAGEVIQRGELAPSVRELARELAINPNTVAKVYRDLEREGVLRTRPGSGAFVADDAGESCVEQSRQIAADALSTGVAKGVAAGLKPKEIRELVTKCLGKAKSHA